MEALLLLLLLLLLGTIVRGSRNMMDHVSREGELRWLLLLLQRLRVGGMGGIERGRGRGEGGAGHPLAASAAATAVAAGIVKVLLLWLLLLLLLLLRLLLLVVVMTCGHGYGGRPVMRVRRRLGRGNICVLGGMGGKGECRKFLLLPLLLLLLLLLREAGKGSDFFGKGLRIYRRHVGRNVLQKCG